MGEVIFRTEQRAWHDASLAKKELQFYRSRNSKKFTAAIEKEENIIRSFLGRAA